MAQKKYITNTYEKGLFMDSTYNSQPPGTYNYALNAVNRDFFSLNELSNEHADRLCTKFDSQIVGMGYIDEKDRFLVFTKDGLFLVNANTCEQQFIAKDSEFGCNWNLDTSEWITPQFKTLDPCGETFVYWSSGCEYYKLNIDEMLNPVRKQSVIDSMKSERGQCSDLTCEYFKVFKISCAPRLTPVAYQHGGAGLQAGAYQFSIKLKNNEGGETNWFTISDPVYIGSEHNTPGEISNGFIEINMSSLDCNYDFGELAVISTIGGITTAKLITQFNYNNGKYSYSYTGTEGDPISIDEIITKGKTYIQGKDLLQYNGNMLYFNLRQTKNLNYQRTANDIKTYWVRYRIPYETVRRYKIKSYMRGEAYGFGIKWNSVDGRSSRVFHIPALGRGSGSNGNSYAVSDSAPAPDGIISISTQGEYRRTRGPAEETVRDPQFDEFDSEVFAQTESITTEVTDMCEALTDCEDCPPAGGHCSDDTPKIDEIGGKIGALLGDYAQDTPDDITVDYSLSSLKQAATNLKDAVTNRERTKYVGKDISVDKGGAVRMDRSTSETITEASTQTGTYFDVNGIPDIELNFKKTVLGPSIPKLEQDILYPDQKDCEGEYIYGDLANTPVRHHQVPWASTVPHYLSNSIGVPSVATPDADEYSDAFIDVIGVKFNDIVFPTEEELGFKLCETNPFTIVQILRTSKNKTIHSKGIITGTIRSTNDGKNYIYPTHGVNSEDSIVNRFINKDGSRLDTEAVWGNDFNYWSLDTMVKAHALNIDSVKVEGVVSGIGYRHGLFALGAEPADSLYGSRIDQRGARQAVNLNKFEPREDFQDLTYKIYAPANEVVSPPSGADAPLMNKYQQESVWLGANITSIKDRSFKGDVLDHDAPISSARAYYVALYRDLRNQYGDLTNMPYIPILQAGPTNKVGTIEGMCGDVFIGPHSFVKTSYVSDRVGEKFPISNMVEGKADRCVCDSPEDVIHSLTGKWVPTEFPKENDQADPKNWCGLHTDTVSHSWTEANTRLPVSDTYYYKTVKTLITYWGEFEVNPQFRVTGDLLEEQVYKHISPEFGLDNTIDPNSTSDWTNDYLNQFYWKVEQPSKWKLIRKVLIRTLLAVIAPMIGIDAILDGSTPVEFIESLGEGAFQIGMLLVMLKILFTNKYLDELLNIGECKMDSEGGEKDLHITNFFQNYNKYNSDFSVQNNIEAFYGIPVPYYTCDCDDCSHKTTNEILISDEQQQGSQLDAYCVVRPNNKINIPASYGGLTDVFIESSNLYAHTTDQIIPLQYGRVSQASSIGEIILGSGPIIAKPVGMAEGTTEGFGGLLSRQHAINTQYGRYFIDYKANKLFFFRAGMKELSNLGVYSHFRNKLQYCESGDIENEHINPNDIALGIDPRLERLLVTKRAIDSSQSWTLSYDILNGNWVSFHSYVPHFYMWDRSHMMSSDGKGLYIHDVKNKFQTFRGKRYPYVIEFQVSDRDILNEIFAGGIIDTFAVASPDRENMTLLDRNVTFNKIWVRNNYQSSGYLDFYPITTLNGEVENLENKMSDNPYINLTKLSGHWSYNQLYDLAISRDQPLYANIPCGVDIAPVNIKDVVGDKDTTSFRNNIHLNNYLTIRFIFDNFDEYKLYTRSHNILVKKGPEFYGN